jgi:hypothetical protein
MLRINKVDTKTKPINNQHERKIKRIRKKKPTAV